MVKYFFKYFFPIISIFIFIDCANVGAPSGGPKDVDAPVVLNSLPENMSKNFTAKKIIIDFDEYIKLQNLNKKLIISPPLDEMPDVKIKNKSLIIDINNELKPNTTYIFNFNDAIADINEGNAKNNFKYVFSTGDVIDSLKMSGKIINSFDLKPVENVFVFLYKNTSDTMPLKQKPFYITKTDKNGNFEFTNISQAKYLIFALDDKNSNFIFDLPNENIAFSDTLVSSFVKTIQKTDTIKRDSLQADTIITKIINEFLPNNLELYLFEENHKKQFLTEQKRVSKELIKLIFNDKLNKLPEIKLIGDNNSNIFIIDTNATKDTLNVWIKDSLTYSKDTLNVSIKHEKTDSSGNIIFVTDTFLLLKPTYIRKGEQLFNNNFIANKIMFNVKNQNVLDIYKNLEFITNVPTEKIDLSKIILLEQKDTSYIKKNAKIYIDTTNKNRVIIKYNWQESGKYKLSIDDSCITDIYNRNNDSTGVEFSVTKVSDYGNLKVNIDSLNDRNIILQLLDSKQNIIKESYINTNISVKFSYLKAGKYNLKIIFDDNNNKIWDTGNFKQKLQPEKIIFFNKEINIRPNWDVEETWNIN